MTNFLEKLLEISQESHVKTGEEMKKHTTFRVGGPAAFFVTPSGKEELAAVLRLCREESKEWFVLGNGSNLLVGDGGYDGVMISMTEGFSYVRRENGTDTITAGAGTLLSRIAVLAREESLTGFEFAAGIPGTLGGAVVMNAGAYGSEMKNVLSRVRVLTPEGTEKILSNEELELGYRTSCILKKGYIVLEAEISLKPGEKKTISETMEDLAERRRSKQPLEYPSAGSTFKRPEGYFAGKLIEQAGLRGYSVGGAQVSEKHCGFVINWDHATAKDVLDLCDAVKARVKENSGVSLEMEVKTLGRNE